MAGWDWHLVKNQTDLAFPEITISATAWDLHWSANSLISRIALELPDMPRVSTSRKKLPPVTASHLESFAEAPGSCRWDLWSDHPGGTFPHLRGILLLLQLLGHGTQSTQWTRHSDGIQADIGRLNQDKEKRRATAARGLLWVLLFVCLAYLRGHTVEGICVPRPPTSSLLDRSFETYFEIWNTEQHRQTEKICRYPGVTVVTGVIKTPWKHKNHKT